MNEVAFVEKRQADWQRLSHLCNRADLSPTQLTDDELLEFIRLYKKVSRDLALVRTRSRNQEFAEHLNAMVSRAYAQLYRPAPKRLSHAIPDALATLAQAGRNLRWFSLASFLIFLAGASFSIGVLRLRPDMRDTVISAQEEPLFNDWKSGKFTERTLEESVMMTGFYSANNPVVAIVTSAVGVATFGIMSATTLFNNGRQIGALGSELASVGQLPKLLTVLPHGVTEISGFLFAGSAGLRLGWAIITPGRRRRADSLKFAGKDAVIAMGGAVLLMLLAAPVEGFLSFNPSIPLFIKMIFAAVVAVCWFLFWTGFGRHSEGATPGT